MIHLSCNRWIIETCHFIFPCSSTIASFVYSSLFFYCKWDCSSNFPCASFIYYSFLLFRARLPRGIVFNYWRPLVRLPPALLMCLRGFYQFSGSSEITVRCSCALIYAKLFRIEAKQILNGQFSCSCNRSPFALMYSYVKDSNLFQCCVTFFRSYIVSLLKSNLHHNDLISRLKH